MNQRLYQRLAFLPPVRAGAPAWILLAMLVSALACVIVLPMVSARLLFADLALAGLFLLASFALIGTKQPAMLASTPAYASVYMRELGAATGTSPAGAEPPAGPSTLNTQRIAELVAVSGGPAQLPALAERGGALLGATLVLIASYDAASNKLHIRAAHGLQASEWLGQQLLWPGLEEMSSTVQSADAQSESQLGPAHALLAAGGSPAAALVPLRTPDGLIGALLLAGPASLADAAAQPAIEVLAGLARISLMQTILHDEASRAARTRAAILDTISHEFRTPITVILGFTELYEEGVLGPISSEEQHEALDAIHRNTYRLLRLVDAMLDLARIETGEIELHCGVVRSAPCLQEALLPFEQIIAMGQLLVDVPDSALPAVWADPQWLRRAVSGMLIFALEMASTQMLRLAAYPAADGTVAVTLDLPGVALGTTAQAGLFTLAQPGDEIWRGSALARLGLELSRRTLELLGGSLRIEQVVGGARLVAELRTAE